MEFRTMMQGLALLGGVSFSTLAAADGNLPGSLKDGPRVAPFSWTGLYIGAHAGYGFSRDGRVDTNYLPDAVTFNARPMSTDIRPNGGLGGAQIGYNLQSGRMVYGLEVDLSLSNIEGSGSAPYLLFNGAPVGGGANHAFRQSLDSFGTARARLGVAAAPDLLVYVTGGLAFERTTYSATTDIIPGLPQGLFAVSETKGNIGWTIGGGAELNLGANWSLKGEYLYYDMGNHTVTAARAVPGGPVFVTSKFENTGQIVRTGLNYKF